MKKSTDRAAEFEAVLQRIHAENLTTLEELMRPEHRDLYHQLWFACDNFVTYALGSKNRKGANGNHVDGNAPRVRTMLEMGENYRDIQLTIMLHLMEKIHKVLERPAEEQKNYCFTMVNNRVVDYWRALCPGGIPHFSLNVTLNGEEDAPEFGDNLPTRSTPEEDHIAREELMAKLQAHKLRLEQEKELERQRLEQMAPQILEECAALADKPEQLLCRLASKYLNRKNAALAEVLLKQGGTKTLAMAIKRVGEKYSIPAQALSLYRLGVEDSRLKLESGDAHAVSAQVSRVIYRAEQRLNKNLVK